MLNSLDKDQARRLSDLIKVETICKGYQQTTQAAKRLQHFSFVMA